MRIGILAVFLLAACGADDDSPDVDSETQPLDCENKSQQLFTDSEWTVQSGLMERRFSVHIPDSYDPTKKTPLLLSFHGLSSNAAQQQLLDGLHAESEEFGFIAVHPEGTGNSWNAGVCCGSSVSNNVDDVQFVSDMLDKLEDELCIDTKRIYSTGMSNGGFMSYRLACELSDRIAAVAPVAGTLVLEQCAPERAVPLIHYHGTNDTLVPYDGWSQYGMPPVEETVQAWAERNGCSTTYAQRMQNGDSTCIGYDDCPDNASVMLCIVDGGGHTWPGGLPIPNLGKTTTDLDANVSMWEFFTEHTL
jgi:polyhydroxybutyrate depolymerase